MSEARCREYQVLFREPGVDNGLNWGLPFFPDGLFVIAGSCIPIGGKDQYVGYAYLPTPPAANVELHLPISGCPILIHSEHGHRIALRPLKRRWYLFYELEW